MKVWGFVLVLVIGCLFMFYGYSSDAHEEHGMHEEVDVGICPVMGNPAVDEYSYAYKGRTYYFCCPMCVEKFKENPEKYISKIKEFNLEAYQFGFSPQQIRVKKGDIVRLKISSRDVPHGVYIKEYGVNVRVEEGNPETVEFLADKAGEFAIKCSVYCGRGHGKMKGKLIVEE